MCVRVGVLCVWYVRLCAWHTLRYMYTSHDLPDQRGWLMRDYVCMSSNDMVNWQDEGVVFSFTADNVTWGQYAWAQQVTRTLPVHTATHPQQLGTPTHTGHPHRAPTHTVIQRSTQRSTQ